ncbi:hypothetical protein EJ357_33660 [Streptomyces cyaneochromogenes]|uniref:DUF3558 domain-containing protein n=1 Tax=Streptomyces cyaneochromogenes TaxID=2496836 RepID=A0A3Q9ES29_9ACTN|nr:hypothetical protein EJ357_33660 [Streptomyces cyaneochromogenes]
MRRIALRAITALVATAVAVFGYLAAHGDFQRWKDESALDGACGGLLDRNVVRSVLGPGSVEAEDEDWGGDGWVAVCKVHVDGGGTAYIRILDTAYAGQSPDSLYTGPAGGDALSVPVGHGWTGLFGADPDPVEADEDLFGADDAEEVTASVVLECTEAGSVKGLYVTVETELDKTLDNPVNRPEFVKIATSTAAKASKARRCDAELGKPVRDLDLPVNEDEYKPLDTADGTCSGIPTAPGVSIATETARGDAPYEVCRLAGADLSKRYVLAAEFGPLAQESFVNYQEFGGEEDLPSPDVPAHDRDTGGLRSWTTAKCPDGLALFTLLPTSERADERKATASDPGLAYERAALRAFAERSARAHGCSSPVKP